MIIIGVVIEIFRKAKPKPTARASILVTTDKRESQFFCLLIDV